MKSRWLALGGALVFPGCFFGHVPGGEDDGSDPWHSSGDPDVAEVEALTAELESHRTEVFDESVDDLEARGDALYFKTFPGFAPRLHRMDPSGGIVDYAFSIGEGDDANERASADAVATVERAGGHLTYHVYDALSASGEIASADFPTPSTEEKWFAYAISGTQTYVLTTPGEANGPMHTLWRFSPGSGPTKVLTLEQLGMSPGEIWDFDVEGATMMLVEQGRLWRIDLDSKNAAWLENETEISGAVNFAKDGVAWEEAEGLRFFDYASGTVRDLSSELQTSAFQINSTFAHAHWFYDKTTGVDFTRWRNWILYTGNLGIFAYDLEGGRIAPVLLDTGEPGGDRVDYVYPVVLDSGAAFVVGLTSTDGALGADGPVYETNLIDVLGL